MSRQVVIIGAGGHSRVLLDALRLSGREVTGFLDTSLPAGSIGPGSVPILGGDSELTKLSPCDVELVNGVGSVTVAASRALIYDRGKAAGFSFCNVVHPSAIIGSDTRFGEGVQIMAGCVIQCGTKLGENCIINTRASVDHDCCIGAHVHVAPGVTISGGVRIGDNVHLGTGAVVIQGMAIGAGSLVAAGAVVYRDLAPGSRLIPGR